MMAVQIYQKMGRNSLQAASHRYFRLSFHHQIYQFFGDIDLFYNGFPLNLACDFIVLFGGGGLLLFAAACAVSYLLSGYYSLYSGQHIIYSKLRAEYINRTTH